MISQMTNNGYHIQPARKDNNNTLLSLKFMVLSLKFIPLLHNIQDIFLKVMGMVTKRFHEMTINIFQLII